MAKAVATATAAATVAAPTCALWFPASVAVALALGLAAISWTLLEIVQSPDLPSETRTPKMVRKVRKLQLKNQKQPRWSLPTTWSSHKRQLRKPPCIQQVENLQQVGLSVPEDAEELAWGLWHGPPCAFQGHGGGCEVLPRAAFAPTEWKILSNLRRHQHRHILKMHACILSGHIYFLVAELIVGRDLETLLFSQSFDDYAGELQFYASQIVVALKFLHDNQIGHFDLKGSSFMVDQSSCLKLVDFGMAEVVKAPLTLCKKSTAHYLAPEIMTINRQVEGSPGYGLAADVWSFGVTLYFLWTGYMPFAEEEEMPFDIYNIVLYDHDGLPDYNCFDYDQLMLLIQPLLCHEPSRRPTFRDLAQDAFCNLPAR